MRDTLVVESAGVMLFPKLVMGMVLQPQGGLLVFARLLLRPLHPLHPLLRLISSFFGSAHDFPLPRFVLLLCNGGRICSSERLHRSMP